MGFPDNNIEPIRENTFDSSTNQPNLAVHQIAENERMEIDDGENFDGYVSLASDDNEQPANDSDSSDSDEEEDENEYTFNAENQLIAPAEAPSDGVPAIVSSQAEIQAEVWNSPRSQGDSIELNTEKTQQILKAMSKFSLPMNAPAWVKDVDPSELIQRIRNKEVSGAPSDNK